jgi:hypothetical protein
MQTIQGSQIAANTITAAEIASGTITGTQIQTSVTLNGNPDIPGVLTVGSTLILAATIDWSGVGVQLQAQNANTLAVYNTSSGNSYQIVTSVPGFSNASFIIWGSVNSSGGTSGGTGFTCSGGGGNYTVNFDYGFVNTPTTVCTIFNSSGGAYTAVVYNNTVNTFSVTTHDSTGAISAQDFFFMVIGTRFS